MKLNRVPVAAGLQFAEGAYDASTGKLTMTVIKPGFNTSKSRFYTESALRTGHKVFEGSKMFVNHQTSAEERARPEGDVNQWVANLTKTWTQPNGTIMAEAVVIDPTFKSKLDNLAQNKLLGEMGISIRAIGEARTDKVDGVETTVVEKFIAARSVDFVTYPGAGGRVETIESAPGDPNDIDLVSVEELRKRRPDLVELIESKLKETVSMKTAEQLQQELDAANAKVTALVVERDAANAKVTTLTTQATEAEKKQKQQVAATELEKLLKESKLPDASKERLKAQFKEAADTTGMKEAIDAEEKYVKSIGGNLSGTARRHGVTDMGERHQDGGSNTDDKKTDLVESFKLMGLPEEQAKIAAKGR